MDIACPTCATTYEIDDVSVGEAGRKVRCASCGAIWRAYRDRPSELIGAPAGVSPGPPVIADPPPLAPLADDILPTPELPGPATYEQFVAPAESPPTVPEVEALGSAAEQDKATAPITAGESMEDEKPARRGARITKPKAAKRPALGAKLKNLFSWPVLFVAATASIAAVAASQRERVVRAVPQAGAVFAAAGAPVNLRGIEIRNVKSRMVEDNGVSVLVIDGDLVGVARERVNVPRLRFAVLGSQGQELYVWSAQADRATIQPGESQNFRRRLAAPPAEGRDVSVRFLGASDITAGLK
jgi:predicted Zn finger-like uncharacterized protein